MVVYIQENQLLLHVHTSLPRRVVYVPDFHTLDMYGQKRVNFDLISEPNEVKTSNLHQNDSMVVYIQENQLLLHVHTSLPRRVVYVPDFHTLGMQGLKLVNFDLISEPNEVKTSYLHQNDSMVVYIQENSFCCMCIPRCRDELCMYPISIH